MSTFLSFSCSCFGAELSFNNSSEDVTSARDVSPFPLESLKVILPVIMLDSSLIKFKSFVELLLLNLFSLSINEEIVVLPLYFDMSFNFSRIDNEGDKPTFISSIFDDKSTSSTSLNEDDLEAKEVCVSLVCKITLFEFLFCNSKSVYKNKENQLNKMIANNFA